MSELPLEPIPPKEVEELLEAVDPQDYDKFPEALRPLIVRLAGKVALRVTEEFSGPLPPPEQLAKYEHILPGAADRILMMAERQAAHRMKLELLVVPQQVSESGRGQLLGFILALIFGALAYAAAVMGHDIFGGVLGGATVIGLVSIFVLGKKHQDASLEEKDSPKDSQAPQLEDKD